MLPRIWLVGDDPGVAARLEARLTAAGRVCERLDSAEAGLRLAGGLPDADCVVVDAGPGGQALDLLTPFREAGFRVLLLVDAEDLPAVEAGLHAQVCCFLVKPCAEAMLEAVLACLPGGEGAAAAGNFPFRTLDDLGALSQLVAGLCAAPEPVQLALFELMLNAVEHGNLGLGFARKAELERRGEWRAEIGRLLDQPAQRARFAWLHVEIRPQALRFVVCDRGRGFDPVRYLEPDPACPAAFRGHGIAIARLLAFPGLRFHEGGRCVEGVVRRGDFHGFGAGG